MKGVITILFFVTTITLQAFKTVSAKVSLSALYDSIPVGAESPWNVYHNKLRQGADGHEDEFAQHFNYE